MNTLMYKISYNLKSYEVVNWQSRKHCIKALYFFNIVKMQNIKLPTLNLHFHKNTAFSYYKRAIDGKEKGQEPSVLQKLIQYLFLNCS